MLKILKGYQTKFLVSFDKNKLKAGKDDSILRLIVDLDK